MGLFEVFAKLNSTLTGLYEVTDLDEELKVKGHTSKESSSVYFIFVSLLNKGKPLED